MKKLILALILASFILSVNCVRGDNVSINVELVNRLVSSQFPQFSNLSIRPVKSGGWDNRTFHLGKNMLVRLPSAKEYAVQIEKEQYWLPKLAPFLPLSIPEPIKIGMPGEGYPYKWSIYRWINGDTAASSFISDLREFARSLAQFLIALQSVDPTGGPLPGLHNFYRGGVLSIYDSETRQAITLLKNKIDANTAINAWEAGVSATWQHSPVWVHGDISAGNLLVKNGQLVGVIDFGMLAVGDPACDLVIAWTLLEKQSREIFRRTLSVDDATWARGRAWALWKAVIVAAGLAKTNAVEIGQSWKVIDEVLADYKR